MNLYCTYKHTAAYDRTRLYKVNLCTHVSRYGCARICLKDFFNLGFLSLNRLFGSYRLTVNTYYKVPRQAKSCIVYNKLSHTCSFHISTFSTPTPEVPREPQNPIGIFSFIIHNYCPFYSYTTQPHINKKAPEPSAEPPPLKRLSYSTRFQRTQKHDPVISTAFARKTP